MSVQTRVILDGNRYVVVSDNAGNVSRIFPAKNGDTWPIRAASDLFASVMAYWKWMGGR